MGSFREDARVETVTFSRADPAFAALAKRLASVTGVYSLEIGGNVLRVGQSTQIGRRLNHHLHAAYGDARAPREEFPDHFEFHRELIGRKLTIRWLACSSEQRHALERAAIQEAAGGVVWEQLRTERDALKKHRQVGVLVRKMKEITASWG